MDMFLKVMGTIFIALIMLFVYKLLKYLDNQYWSYSGSYVGVLCMSLSYLMFKKQAPWPTQTTPY